MARDLTPEERKAAERLRKAVHSLDTCDHCSWVITSEAAYRKHLRDEHPEGE